MGLHIYIKFENDALYTDVTEFVKYNSVKFDVSLCNEKFKATQDSVSLKTVYDEAINAKFFEATTWMPAYIVYDQQEERMYGYEETSQYGYGSDVYGFLSPGRIFTGAVYPSTKEKLTDFPADGVSFEIVDNNYLLDKDTGAISIPESLSDTWYVYNPSDVSHSFVHKLLIEAGLTLDQMDDTYAITDEVSPISFEAKDETYQNIIEDLLYEYHHVHYFDENGIFRMYNWKHTSPAIVGTITESEIKDSRGVQRERNIYDFDGYDVVFNPLSTKENALLYRSDLEETGKLLLPSQAFPVDGELKTVNQEYETTWLTEDAKIVFTANHELVKTHDAGIEVITELYENEKAQIVVKNTGLVDARLYQLDIRGDAVYEDGEERLLMPSTATKTDDELKLKYVRTSALAQSFAEALYNNTVKFGLYTYDFSSDELYTVGSMYTLTTRQYSVNVLIIAKSFNYYQHIYNYQSIEIGQDVEQTGDTSSTRPGALPQVVDTTKIIELSASSPAIFFGPRGNLKTEEIIITLSLANLSAVDAVWSATSGTLEQIELSPGVYDLYKRKLLCSTVTADSIEITVTITSQTSTYSKTLVIPKHVDGIAVPYNFGGVALVPTETPSGEPLVSGDYFLWTGATSGGYTKGEIYEYDGTSWVVSTNGDLVMTLFDSFADLANDVESTVIGNAVIKKLVAVEAFIETLMAKELIVTNLIKTQNNNVVISSNGSITAINAILEGGAFTGSVEHPSFKTVLEASPSSPISIPSKTRWRADFLYNALSSIAVGNTWKTAGGSYLSKSIDAVSRIDSRQRLILASASGGDSGNAYANVLLETITVPKGVNRMYFWFDVEGQNGSGYIYATKNKTATGYQDANLWSKSTSDYTYGVHDIYTTTRTDIASGDVIRIYSYRTDLFGYNFQVQSNEYDKGTFIRTSDGEMYHFLYGGYYTSPVSISSPNSYTSAINYVLASSVASMFNSYGSGGTYKASGTLNVDGTNRDVTNLMRDGSNIAFYFTSGNPAVLTANDYDGATYGSYNVSGSVTVVAQEAGILVRSITPMVNATSATTVGGTDIGNGSYKIRNITGAGNITGFDSLTVDDFITAPLINLGIPSLSANGYTMLPNGLILQWGSFVSTTDDGQTVYYPFADWTAYQVVVDTENGITTQVYNDRFVFNRTNTIDGDVTARWFAIGEKT